ncbi:14 kDa phosphohistidine phosphatase-like [Hylaeus anthracinus]|uniref:14 kDa phosphohistidine phosphatase-like n=1 Tax=Hylaeus anthracinus TaxID=313031 RepID=UPI0023BA35CE|nr:14 kDa phosphohistidine phosphatase-like [Hylaeus anthracinus]
MAASFKNFGICVLNSRYLFFEAVFSNNRHLATMSQSLNKVPDVDIDGHGKFKYILIKVQDEAGDASKSIVRGYARAEYHADIFDIANAKVTAIPGLTAKCMGGGRIEHDPDERTLKVYGYSQGYGKADHEMSVGILKKKYPNYTITWTDEGY